MSQQPEALRLADELHAAWQGLEMDELDRQAAAELRRLHDENGRLLQANLDEHEHYDELRADYIQQSAINAKLLEALEKIDGFTMSQFKSVSDLAACCQETACAAIQAARRNI